MVHLHIDIKTTSNCFSAISYYCAVFGQHIGTTRRFIFVHKKKCSIAFAPKIQNFKLASIVLKNHFLKYFRRFKLKKNIAR